MVLLSFSVESLWPKLWQGQKTRTMRPAWVIDEKTKQPRRSGKWMPILTKDPQKVAVNLGWKTRSKNGFMLFDAPLKSVELKTLGWLSVEEWKADGFESAEQGKAWFASMYPYYKLLDSGRIETFEVYLIQWGCGSCEHCTFKDHCVSLANNLPEGSDVFGQRHLKWGKDHFCPAWKIKAKRTNSNQPRFINLKEISDTPKRPEILSLQNEIASLVPEDDLNEEGF
jgi:hypothetical protein